MNDPRIIDSVRKTSEHLTVVLAELRQLKEDNKYIKEMLRTIKKSVVRKYSKDES